MSATRSASRSTPRSRPSWPSSPPKRPRRSWKISGSISRRSTCISLAAYRLLDLIPFFTTGPTETRAWTIRRGQNAQRAAGRIHSDLERGFIRAEVVPTEQLLEAGSEVEAKKRGWVRVEGRDYVVVDGDVLNVRFNV